MTRNKPLTSLFLILVLLLPLNFANAQKRPARPRPAPKPVVSQPVSFDNLLSTDTYKIYVEVRNVGQLISSGSVNELLEPVLKLAAPPKEFKTAVKWLTAHAQEVMTSKLLVAAWPTAKNVPDVLIAVEFDNPDEAAKFDPQVKAFLPKILPAPTASPSPSATTTSASKDQPVAATASPNTTATPAPKDQTATPSATISEPQPTFFVKRAGNLVFITNTALTLKNLRPANSKPLAEDSNFRTIHDRFATEPIFAFLNVKALEKEEEDRRQQTIDKREAANREVIAETESTGEQKKDPAESDVQDTATFVPDPKVAVGTVGNGPAEQTTPDPITMALTQLAGSFFGGGGFEQKWPEAIGFGVNLDSAYLDIRALLVNSPSEKAAAIPFLPALVSGPTIIPESPAILPADTELFVVMSLDLPQIYAGLSHPQVPKPTNSPTVEAAAEVQLESPFAVFEKRLGIKFETDLVPLIGNEIVFSMPVAELDLAPQPPRTTNSEAVETGAQTASGPSPIIALSLRDKAAVRVLLPKIVDAFAFKGASGFAQTETREDTEIVSYANVLSYAFIGNFLVLSTDVKAIRHVVDSYLKHETLSSDVNFRNFTRWQPRQLQGQVYISPALMESYKNWAGEPNVFLSDQARELLSRLTITAEPITYSLSNEGMGPLHQVRIPKNLVLMAVTGISGEANPPPMVANERVTIGALYTIAYAESTIHAESGSYVTLDDLVNQQKISREMLDGYGYKVYVSVSSAGFEAVAVPVEYGKTGKMSYFVNEDRVLRGADNGGAPASAADKPIN